LARLPALHYLPEDDELPEFVEPPELGTVCRSFPLVLLPGVLEPFFDGFESGDTVFRSLPLVLLPGVFDLAPDEDDDIPPEEEL
jgi:hypothetical protein